tara:strand:+ start:8838 stop:9551 length:714 start_codon:yes stop_codon:yes gene_type:complete
MTDRYFFLHLQKTGGSALKMRLRHCLGERAVYPCPDDGDLPDAVIRPARLLERMRERGEEVRVVAGHFPLATVDLLPGEYRTFTLLREPVERTLSFLRHQVRTGNTSTDDLMKLYEDPSRYRMLHNHMTKMLALDAERTLSGGAILAEVEMTDELLQLAQQRLAKVDVVGVQEHYDEFVMALEREFGWDLGPPLTANQTEARPVDAAFRERIAEDNALDVALYEYALGLVATAASTT